MPFIFFYDKTKELVVCCKKKMKKMNLLVGWSSQLAEKICPLAEKYGQPQVDG